MEKKTFMQKLKNMGPAAIITSAFIGPGTITTATLVGVKFQYALLWAVVFSGIALIVLMEMSSRIAIASHKNVIDAAIALKPESRGWRLFVQIFVGLAVGISCFAFQSGNEIGASAGLHPGAGHTGIVSGGGRIVCGRSADCHRQGKGRAQHCIGVVHVVSPRGVSARRRAG